MDVVLHLGAHRTGTTTFQNYMHRQRAAFVGQGVGYWGPRPSPDGLQKAILSCDPAIRDRAHSRVQFKLAQVRARGLKRLVVSDQNMIGQLGDNLGAAQLYTDAGDRMARFAAAFGGQITSLLICPRALDHYWTSALAAAVYSGHSVPGRDRLHQIAMSRRGWRDVITDIASAVPGIEIQVLPHESYAGRPDAVLRTALGLAAPADKARPWLKRVPALPDLRRALTDRSEPAHGLPFGMGRWNPFTNAEHAALRETHADDMMWLTAGADGLARLTEDRRGNRAGPTSPPVTDIKGQNDEHEEKQMARPG